MAGEAWVIGIATEKLDGYSINLGMIVMTTSFLIYLVSYNLISMD